MSCSCRYGRAFFHGYGNLSCDLHKKLEDLSQIGACERTAAGHGARSLCGEPKESFDETDLSDDVAFRQPSHLSLSDHVHRLVTRDGPQCAVNRAEPKTRRDALLHEAMILLQYVVQVGTGSTSAPTAEFPILL